MYYSRKRRRSKKIFISVAIIAALLFLATGFFINRSPNEVVVAKVNDQKIYKSELEAKLHDIFSSQDGSVKTPEIEKLPKEVLEILVKEIYLEKELVKKAESEGLNQNQDIKKQVEQSKNRILRQAYIEKLTSEAVTDEKVNNKYLELTKDLEGKKEYQISHIVVKTKEEAEDILKKLKKAKFSDLAKKYSIDKESSEKGGNLDFILEDNLVKEIAEVASSLKINEVSQPIQTKFGWHIVKVNEVKDAVLPPFESLKDTIKDQLKQEITNEVSSKITNNIKLEILVKSQEEPKEEAKSSEGTTNEEALQESEIEALATEEKSKEETAEASSESAVASEKVEDENSTKESEVKPEEKKEEKSDKKSSSKEKTNAKKSQAKSKKSH